MPVLAVVIPTRDRTDLLADCLATLSRQTLQDIEVLVVDDGSEEPLAPLVAAANPKARCHRQLPSGLNAARNAGARLTTAPVIAYIDDDTLVPPTWAEAVVQAFATTDCSGLAGRVELELPHAPPRWLTSKRRSYLAELDLGAQRRWLTGRELPVGANCGVRRDDFTRIGGFKDGFDRNGKSLISSGDTEFFLRLQAAGGRLLYEPGAWLTHRVPPERLTFEWFTRRAYAQGASDDLLEVSLTDRSASRRRARGYLRGGRAVPIAAKALAMRRGTANAMLWLHYCRGRLAAINAPPVTVAREPTASATEPLDAPPPFARPPSLDR